MSELRQSVVVDRMVKRYGRVAAVDDVTLAIERGEFVTLLGPSGSGKTTILMAIAGFVQPTSGEILLDGQAITRQPPEHRNFGMVFQGYALFPHMTVFENVAFPLRARARPNEEVGRRVKDALEMVQLGPYATRMPRQLSGGQQQRVALARALVFTPHLLLLDEPLSALDKKLRAELQLELKALHERVGLTFLYVTHDQDEALSMSDRVAILREGKLVQFGRPRDLYERPATRFVADFLGKSNFLPGIAQGAAGGVLRYASGGLDLVQALEGAAPPAGSPVLVALRPEKIAVVADTPPETANAVSGRIAQWSYSGTHFQLLVDTDSVGRMTATVPSWRCRIEPEVGRTVHLGWDPDATVIVTDDGAATADA
ncbi:putative spermidine/putrescine transport system ATP-binding protein [Stella humosa]|uniref:Spermidine/putrescine import ATP-binding protein PotA n=1 Tax=Stella humosa TaxID=94 RepID=A0A3N1M707_9PROT|nr:ABC transporter ATP-binding protein [Stella humosa]ROQ01612.1 putative spermidine/putrescine transport system ATP-binding protein [Stella humosa]BBK31993.1 ABC transporter ATP-binding protein [Stella humosa]